MIRRVDIGEFNTIKNDNDFICNRYNEYKGFNAEKYNVSEQKDDYNEFIEVEEINTQQSKPQENKKVVLERDKLKDISNSGNVNQINAVANTSVTASTTLSASTSIAASTFATAAVGVISFLVITNIDTVDYSKYFEFDSGSDYTVLTVDYQALEQPPNDSRYTILVDVDEGMVEIELNDTQDEYFIGNLQINTKYNYCLVLNEYLEGNLNQKVLYESSFTTTNDSSVKVIYDTNNNFIRYDYDTLGAYLNHSLYLSDPNHSLIEPTLFITSSPIEDVYDITKIIYDNNELDNNFFTGCDIKINHSKIYLNVVGFIDDNLELVYSREIDSNLPNDFRIMEFNNNMFNIDYYENSITITNEVDYLDDTKTIYYYVTQYDEYGNTISRNDQLLNITQDNMKIEIIEETEYYLKQFQYGLYTIIDNQVISIYDSEKIDYTFNHDYKAYYQVQNLNNADIVYHEDHLTVIVDSLFTSNYDGIYTYKLNLYNGNHTLIGEYYGTAVASFEIYDFSNTQFYLEYVEIGVFKGQEIEYQRFTTEKVELCLPSISLNEEVKFIDDHFNIDYTLNMNYDYSKASMVLQIEDGNEIYTKTIDNLYQNDTIYLDCFDKEIKNAKVTATLTFKDNQLNQVDNTITSLPYYYSFQYVFNVEKVVADMYVNYEGSSTVPITIDFSYSMPSSYMINVTDNNGIIDDTFVLKKQYYCNKLSKADASVLTITVFDQDGLQWKDSFTYDISFDSANVIYKENYPSYYAINPYDSLVTYNEDGTINIYRKIRFSSTNENIYCNAFIYNSYTEDPITGQKIYEGAYDVISNSDYAIIENIPDQMYILDYQLIIKNNGVDYIMYIETPSGTINTNENIANAYLIKEAASTIVSINCTIYGKIENKISCINNTYEYSTYQGEFETQHSIVFDEVLDIQNVGIYFSIYYQNYDEYGSEIAIKGNLYKEYILEVQETTIQE